MFRGNGRRGRRYFSRGNRGRDRYKDFNDDRGEAEDASSSYKRDRSSGRPRRPPGLRGKEIGLWYARHSVSNKQKLEENLPRISMNTDQVNYIGKTLESCENAYETPNSTAGSSKYLTNKSIVKRANVVDMLMKSKFDCNIEETSSECEATASTSSIDRNTSAQSGTVPDTGFKDEYTDDFKEDVNMEYPDGFDDPEGFINQNNQRRMEGQSVFARLGEIKDSKFKRAYADNVFSNQIRDQKGTKGMLEEQYISVKRSRNATLDSQFFEEFKEKQNSPRFQEMLKFRKRLPSYEMRNDVIKAVRDNRSVVISGETGCGKTTQVAQFILDDCIERKEGSTCRIICTQPRRISAISVAERVAQERAESLGSAVGYQIRLEHVLPRKSGCILYCTSGIVLKMLQSDPLLSGVSHLILDEVHERDMNTDFLLCISRDVAAVRPDLKIILMSATLNAELFSDYFGGSPMLHIPGFTYPVEEFYLEDVLEMTRYEFPGPSRRSFYNKKKESVEFQDMISPYLSYLETEGQYSHSTLNQLSNPQSEELDMGLVLALLKFIHRKPLGAVLVFVPGWSQISSLHRMIQEDGYLGGSDCLVIPLHSLLPTVNQREVFNRPKKGVRKIVIATNIAETSITIDDIVYVIDCGKIKLKNYDKASNVSTLLPEWVALANARQRRGRAGRVQEGICYHLYSKVRESTFDAYQLPEMLRTRLEEILLQVKVLKLGSCEVFLRKVMQPPDPDVVGTSIQMLKLINAFDDDENLTPLGFHLARFPMDPLTGKMLLMGAIFSCLGPILTVAASLSFKDPFFIPMGKESLVDKRRKFLDDGRKSDHLLLATVYDGWERAMETGGAGYYTRDNFLSTPVLQQLKRMRLQFIDILKENHFIKSSNPNAAEINRNSLNLPLVKAVITAGLYPNVARVLINKDGILKGIKLRDIRKVALHPKSVNDGVRRIDSHWMVYWEIIKSTKVFLHDTTVVMNYPLLFFGQKLNYSHEDGLIDVDGFVKIKCSREEANIIEKLRNELDKLLEHKISHPGVTNWNTETKEGKLLSTIVDIIAHEENVPSAHGDDEDY